MNLSPDKKWPPPPIPNTVTPLPEKRGVKNDCKRCQRECGYCQLELNV